MDEKKQITAADFQGMKLCISTPMYRAEVCDAYHDSRRELDTFIGSAGLRCYYGKVRDTYLPRARNILAAQMLETDATIHLLLDSDMGFNAADVVRMLYHIHTRPDIEIIGAAYPARVLDWQRVKDAVLANPEVDASLLPYVAASRWTFTGLPEAKYNMSLPIELTGPRPHIGTGCMAIKRIVYESMKKLPINYTDDVTKRPRSRFFHCDIDMKTGIWHGEDVLLCHEWKKMGGKLWLAPWVRTEHWGPMCVPGDISKVIDAGVSVFA